MSRPSRRSSVESYGPKGPIAVDLLDGEALAHLIRAGLLVRDGPTVTAAAATTFYDLAREFPDLLPT